MTESRPKILFIAPLPPPVHGASIVGEVLRGSDEVKSSFDGDWVNLSVSSSVSEIGRVGLGKPLRVLVLYLRVLARLICKRYDLCYVALTCHGAGFLKDAPIALMCKLFSKKLLIHQHNKGMSEDVGKWPYKWLLPAVYKGSKVMLLSERLYPDVAGVVGTDQLVICPNGIPAPPVSAPRTNNGVPVLLFLSNLLAAKGIHVFIEACSILKNRGLDFKCVIAGAESSDLSAAALEASLSEHGLDGIAEYRGPVRGEEKEDCWNGADIFVLPTMNECFPLVLLEAMSHGVPVVTTSQGGIPDIVLDGETGCIVSENNAETVAGRIQSLLEHPESRAAMGEAGRMRYQENFTQEIFISRFCDCINSVLEK